MSTKVRIPGPRGRIRNVALKLTEAQIQQTCTQFLEADGWRAIRMEQNFSEKKQKSVGEKGMPDYLYLRYEGPVREEVYPGPWDPKKVATNILWVEWKSKKGKAAQHQIDWHAREVSRGAIMVVAGRTCPATIEGFREWYRRSGLGRKVR